MAEHEGESKKKENESFTLFGSSGKEEKKAEHPKEERKESREKSGKDEYVLDFSRAETFLDEKRMKILKKVSVYVLLLIILLIAADLRLKPINTYPAEAPLGSADNWWQYRHAKEIYEHGYPGTGLKVVDGKEVPWDYLHNAPEGSEPPYELYNYFVGYSYKYIGEMFFPTLIEYMKFAPVLFATLAVLMLFFLIREIFGTKSALLGAFLFAFSAPYLQRSVVGQADSDAIIVFFTILTVFLFFKAWKEKSFWWAGFAAIGLGMYGFSWPGGYTATALVLIFGIVAYYMLRILEITLFKNGPLSGIKWQYIALLLLSVFATFILLMKLSVIDGLIYGGAFLFIVALVVPLLLMVLKDMPRLKQFIRDEWRGIAVIGIFLGVGLALVAIITGPVHANLFSAFEGFSTLKAAQRAAAQGGGADVVRNVFLTVAEFNPAAPRIVTFSVHIAVYILAVFSIFALPLWFYRNIKEEKSHLSMYAVPFILVWLGMTYFASLNGVRFLEYFSIPMIIVASAIIGIGDYLSVFDIKKNWRTITTVILALLIVFILLVVPNISPVKGENQIGAPYVQNAIGIAERSGGGEGKNWLDFYKWMRESTPKDAIFASWWDPGHGVTALGERPVVADGSQSHKHVHDLALMFTLNNTGNVTLALDLMKKYEITYFFTSSDLIGKYGPISFLGTGNGENYQTLSLDKNQISQASNGDYLLSYPFEIYTERGPIPTIILFNLRNNGTDADAALKVADNAPRKLSRVYFTNKDSRLMLKENSGNDTIDLSLFVLPGLEGAFLMQPHIEKNLLTRLHIFDGNGLEDKFEKVKDFGGEIKVYKVKYENFK